MCHTSSQKPFFFFFKPSPVEGVCLRNGSVQSAGCPVTDQLKQQHHAVARLLGYRQIHRFPGLGGDLDDWIADSSEREARFKGRIDAETTET